ncbi:MAG TPA: hypothetical protein VGM67_06955 [Gemmatimonadaceae bacterium]
MSVRSNIRASAALLASLLACLLPHRVEGQSSTSLLTDASVLPRGGVGLTLLSNWTRVDALLGGTPSPRNLGFTFNTDSLGAAQIPAFSPTQSAIRTLSGVSNFQLSAGQLSSVANSRIVTSPLIAEVGLTSRLTLGIVIPIVETRTTLISRLNSKRDSAGLPVTGFANVGPNPYRLSQNYGATSAVLAEFTNATTALQALLATCQANPGNSGCAAVNSQAPTLLASASTFTNTFTTLYGTDHAAHPGQEYVPLAGSAIQSSINRQIESFRNSYASLLNSTVALDTIAGARGPAANLQLDTLLAHAGYDTLGIADHSSIGDISIGATLELINTYGDSIAAASGGTMFRLAINGTGRIGTGQPANRNRLFDNATGFGQPGAIVGLASDLRFARRFTLSAVGSYTANFGSVDISRVPNFEDAIFPLTGPVSGTYSAGNIIMASFTPRVELARYFAFNGEYQIVHVAADKYTVNPAAGDTTATDAFPAAFSGPPGFGAATAHQVGFGFSYSTVSSGDRGHGLIPFEVIFRHLETIAVNGGVAPKTFEDQITLKIFLHR